MLVILQMFFLAVVLPIVLSMAAANLVFRFIDKFNDKMKTTNNCEVSSLLQKENIVVQDVHNTVCEEVA